ncbi:MAG: anti-sigma factor [Acidobacteria bacterium]|nr:anti-sigma factor [Acidobacteriota bacterium]
MTNEELNEQYELFVLGVAEPEVADEIRAKLAAGDPEVTQGVALARELVAGLAFTAPEVDPPDHLRKKIVAAVSHEPQTFPRWFWVWATATALVTVVAFNFWQREQKKGAEVAEMRQLLIAQSAELKTVSQLLEFLNEPELKLTTFGTAQPAPPRGRVLVSPNKGVLLLVSNLPPAAQGRIYQMWLVPKQGGPVPMGLFQTTAQGTALHVRPGTVDLASAAAIAVSLEPEAGSTAPTTTPFIIAPVAE